MSRLYPVEVLHENNQRTILQIACNIGKTKQETRKNLAYAVLKNNPRFGCAVCHIRGAESPNVGVNAFTDDVIRDRVIVSVVCDDETCLALNTDLHRRSQKSGVVGKCSVCGKETKEHCGKCPHVFYCSVDCQKRDWKMHKLVCDRKFVQSVERDEK